jgi:hypothetical protein
MLFVHDKGNERRILDIKFYEDIPCVHSTMIKQNFIYIIGFQRISVFYSQQREVELV